MHQTTLLFTLCVLFSCQDTADTTPSVEADPDRADTSGQDFSRLDVPWKDVAALPATAPDHRIAYGEAEQQFGELRLPATAGPHPVVVFLHGGCWLAEYDYRHVGPVSADLAARGYAVWTPEYRRVGDPGGGWPGTFADIGQAVDFLRTLAERYPLDLDRITVMGHSAGGHLALWQALRPNLPADSPLYTADPLPVQRVISLAGITDLVAYHEVDNSCSEAVPRLMDGEPAQWPERYRQGSPSELLPATTPMVLVHGTADPIVPLDQATTLVAKAQLAGSDIRLLRIEGGGHFDLVFPGSVAWGVVVGVLGR